MKNQNQKNQKNKTQSYNKKRTKTGGESDSDSPLWICGKHPSFSALLNKKRKIFEILVTQNSVTELTNFLQKNSLSHFKNLIKLVEKEQIEKILRDQVHQGIAVNCSKLPLKNQYDLLSELYEINEGEKLPILLLLDQITDPHNVGALIRSAAAFGVKHIIFCEHNSAKESSIIAKSSAGTIEFSNLYAVTNFNNLIEKLKKIGYWCVGLAGEGNVKLDKISEYKNIALIVGSEGNGLRDLVKKNCDLLAKIKMDPKVESLNASVAASIALYEITKNQI